MNNLQFGFTVDKIAETVYITREFNAKLSLVWDASLLHLFHLQHYAGSSRIHVGIKTNPH